jgi:hypothetical protein
MRRPSHAQRAPAPTAHNTWPTRGRGPGRGSPRAPRWLSKNARALAANGTTRIFTIPVDSCYARTPSPFPIFTSGKSPTLLCTPARRWPTLVGYVGQRRASTAHPRGRRSPWCRRKAQSSGTGARDGVARPPHDGDQPARAAPAFRWAGALREWQKGTVSSSDPPWT